MYIFLHFVFPISCNTCLFVCLFVCLHVDYDLTNVSLYTLSMSVSIYMHLFMCLNVDIFAISFYCIYN